MVKIKLETLTPVVIHQEEFGDMAYLIRNNQRVSLSKDAELKAIKEIKDIVKKEQLNASLFKRTIRKIYEKFLYEGNVVPLYGVENHTGDNIIYLNNISLMTVKTYKEGRIVPYIPGSSIKGMIRQVIEQKYWEINTYKIKKHKKDVKELQNNFSLLMNSIQVSDFYSMSNDFKPLISLYHYNQYGVGYLVDKDNEIIDENKKKGISPIDLNTDPILKNARRLIKNEIDFSSTGALAETINKGIRFEGNIDIRKNVLGYRFLKKIGIEDVKDILDLIKEYIWKRYKINRIYYGFVKKYYSKLEEPVLSNKDIFIRMGHGKPFYYSIEDKLFNSLEYRMEDPQSNNYYHPNEKFVYSYKEDKIYPLGWVKIVGRD